MLDPAHIRYRCAAVESAFRDMNTIAQDAELPQDVRQEADELSGRIASLQTTLARRAYALDQMRQ